MAVLASAGFAPAASRAAPGGIAAIEAGLGGRIGVAMLDTGTGRTFAYRGDERFALCSTFKAALAACVLQKAAAGALDLAATLRADSTSAISNSPMTAAAQGGPMSLRGLCAAAVTYSDNTAANLLLSQVGGPRGLTRFFRALGDPVSRLDRTEPALNENRPGDVRDTTTAAAMAHTLEAILLGRALTAPARQTLAGWMLDERNGRRRIRAGAPPGWRVANKPGTSGDGAVNDIAVLWPPSKAPVVVAIYTNAPRPPLAVSEGAIVQTVKAGLAALGAD